MSHAGGRRRRGDSDPESPPQRQSDHGHSHDLSSEALDSANPTSPLVRAVLIGFVGLVTLVAVASTIVLWPHGDGPSVPEGYQNERIRTELTAIGQCPGGDPTCLQGTVEVNGERADVSLPTGDGAPAFSVGDRILVNDAGADATKEAGQARYTFLDFDRTTPLIWLVVLFVLAVLLLSRLRGLASLISLGLSLLAVTVFVLPALLAGASPLAVALTASALILVVAIYASQGVSVRSSVALAGTLVSLGVAGGIGYIFTAIGKFTGFSDDSVKYLVAILGDVDVRGLLLAGLIIGALGVLDDVTVTQTAAVWEIAAADPTASRRSVFAAAMRIGRAHVSATVNTLVLAYVGASLPLLMLLSAIDASARDQLLSEGIAQEIVRGLAGSLGIVAAVPITTALAAAVVNVGGRDRGR